jgi:hypothetical protein
MSDDVVVAPGTAGSFEDPRHLEQSRPRSGGWRALDAPVTVRAYVGETWVDAEATDVNDQSREVRLVWPPRRPGELSVHHMIVDASHYEPTPRLFDEAAHPA